MRTSVAVNMCINCSCFYINTTCGLKRLTSRWSLTLMVLWTMATRLLVRLAFLRPEIALEVFVHICRWTLVLCYQNFCCLVVVVRRTRLHSSTASRRKTSDTKSCRNTRSRKLDCRTSRLDEQKSLYSTGFMYLQLCIPGVPLQK